MGKFIDEVGKNNQLQKQQLTYKHEQQKKKEEKEALKTLEHEKIIDLEYLLSVIFEKAKEGKTTKRQWTPHEIYMKCQQLQHRNSMIKDIGRGKFSYMRSSRPQFRQNIKKSLHEI